MSLYDLIIRDGTLVRPDAVDRADVAVVDGRIVAIAPDIEGRGSAEIDATGLHVLAGTIDVHVHLNEPGRTDWEGWASGTRALAAGGATTCFDMPLNSSPPTLDAASFDLKLACAQRSSLVDFGLWGGLTPGNLEHLEELNERGVIGFKAFMSNSGIDDFQAVDDLTLYEGMLQAARFGRIVAVHAENDRITGALARRAIDAGQTTARAYMASRPVIAELEAIARAILLAEETGCALHIVHVSTGRGVELVAAARARGVDVSCETCPHYLVLTEDDLETLGAVAKCAPPLRFAQEQAALWEYLTDGTLPLVASDHSPAPASMKGGQDFFKIWGGISGCQSLLQLLLTEGYHQRGLALQSITCASAEFAARRFALMPDKGCLAVGADADLVLIDLDNEFVLQADHLFYRHQHSPFIGRSLKGQIVRTVLRGTTVFLNGDIISEPIGRLLTPHSAQRVSKK